MVKAVEDPGYTTKQVAFMLGLTDVSVRRWRVKNKQVGMIKYGPPYEYHGAAVVYPKEGFTRWCTQLRMVNGAPHINLPITADVALPRPSTAQPEAELAYDAG